VNKHSQSEEYQNAVFYLGHLSALSAELSCLENLKYLNALNQSTDEQKLIAAKSDPDSKMTICLTFTFLPYIKSTQTQFYLISSSFTLPNQNIKRCEEILQNS
jgi:hypothetical protein